MAEFTVILLPLYNVIISVTTNTCSTITLSQQYLEGMDSSTQTRGHGGRSVPPAVSNQHHICSGCEFMYLTPWMTPEITNTLHHTTASELTTLNKYWT